MSLLKSRAFLRFSHQYLAITIVLLISVVGAVTLLFTRAVTPSISVEPESGTLAGAVRVSDDLASAKSAVKFSETTGSISRCPEFPSFPTAECTGVPPGVTLRPSGSISVTQDNTVIDGLLVNGKITVAAKNVIIRNTAVRTLSDIATLEVLSGSSVEITDSEFGRTGIYTTANNFANILIRSDSAVKILRANIYGGADLVKVHSNTSIIDSYLHDPYHPEGGHSDLIQYPALKSPTVLRNISIVHNTLLVKSPTTGDNGNTAFIEATDNEISSNFLFEKNYLNGGNYSIYCPSTVGNDNVVIRNNKFGRDYRFGPAACSYTDETYVFSRDNVFLDTGLPVKQ